MIEQFRFGRLDSKVAAPYYKYIVKTNQDAMWFPHDVTMEAPGMHWSVSIRNYMQTPVVLMKSMRCELERIDPISSSKDWAFDDTANFVVVELRSRTVGYDKSGKVVKTVQKKVDVHIPGYHLEKNAAFIEEMGWYIGLPGHIDSMRGLMHQDVNTDKDKGISVPKSSYEPDPVAVFGDFGPLLRNAVERMDKLRVKVGIDVYRLGLAIPNHIKDFRISVLDMILTPYRSARMVYDPTLGPDDLVLESVHSAFSDPIITTFSNLRAQDKRRIYLDTEEHDTLRGKRNTLVMFADPDAVALYELENRSKELYETLAGRVIGESGGYTLRKTIDAQVLELAEKDKRIDALEENVKFEKGTSKDMKRQLDTAMATIAKLRNHTEQTQSFDAIQTGLQNERDELQLAREKLQHEREELDLKNRTAKSAYTSSMLKSLADMTKSVWGLATIAVTVTVAALQLYNKLLSKPA